MPSRTTNDAAYIFGLVKAYNGLDAIASAIRINLVSAAAEHPFFDDAHALSCDLHAQSSLSLHLFLKEPPDNR